MEITWLKGEGEFAIKNMNTHWKWFIIHMFKKKKMTWALPLQLSLLNVYRPIEKEQLSLCAQVCVGVCLCVCVCVCLRVGGGGGGEWKGFKGGRMGEGEEEFRVYSIRLIHQIDRIVFVTSHKPIDQSVLLRK